jgi:hypothetical protein
MLDDSGNEYKINNIQLGSQKGRYRVQQSLVSGVPIKARFDFEMFLDRQIA